jgi:uncharacterized membrane protein
VGRERVHHRHTGVPKGFRPRGPDVTRIEGFSDAVFAFALTLLVVSLEVPRTFPELVHTVRGFVPFAICFALLLQIWFKHYGFFRRYGLQDVPTRLLNSVLLFIVLFYVYPLKYLWSHMVAGNGSPASSIEEGRFLLEIYGLGGAAVFTIFVLLYHHAWRLRDELELTPLERYDTRSGVVENGLLAAVPALSALLAWLLPARVVGLAGLLYFAYGPLLTVNGMREARGRRRFELAAQDAPAPVSGR